MDTLIRVRRPLAVMVGLGLTAMLLIGAGSVGAAPGDLDTTTTSRPAMTSTTTTSLSATTTTTSTTTTSPSATTVAPSTTTTVALLLTTTRSPALGMVPPRPVYIG